MIKILVVEDDLALSTGVCFELDTSGYLSVSAYNCQRAKQILKEEHFDLVILDINLPDGNGFELCHQIKMVMPELPIIFLTANTLEEDILNGFDLGADDYITKPFNIQILKRRVEVALRRGTSSIKTTENCYNDGFLYLDFNELIFNRNGEKLTITPNEYKLLRFLISNAEKVVTRKILLEKLWDCNENYIDDHTLTVTMNRLRAKIEEENHSYIQTIRGMGYIWTGAKE